MLCTPSDVYRTRAVQTFKRLKVVTDGDQSMMSEASRSMESCHRMAQAFLVLNVVVIPTGNLLG